MAFNLQKEIDKLTGKLTDTLSAKAKTSAITTLNDPEFKATVNKFTKDWAYENRVLLISVVGSFVMLSVLAVINIISNFSGRKK